MIYDLGVGARIVFALLDMLDEAVQEGSREAVISVMEFLADALASMRKGMTEDPHFGLGGRAKSWKDMGPEEILDYMRTAIALEQAMIERKQEKIPLMRHASAKRLSEEIRKSLAVLRRMTAQMKAYLIKHWPEFWTESVAKEFSPWL